MPLACPLPTRLVHDSDDLGRPGTTLLLAHVRRWKTDKKFFSRLQAAYAVADVTAEAEALASTGATEAHDGSARGAAARVLRPSGSIPESNGVDGSATAGVGEGPARREGAAGDGAAAAVAVASRHGGVSRSSMGSGVQLTKGSKQLFKCVKR